MSGTSVQVKSREGKGSNVPYLLIAANPPTRKPREMSNSGFARLWNRIGRSMSFSIPKGQEQGTHRAYMAKIATIKP